MKFNLETIVVIIIVLLFVGSIFAYSFSGNRTTNYKKKINDVNKNDENQEITIFNAEIDSNLLEIYPQLIMTSNTTEFSKDKIDAELRKIVNIKTINTNFNKGEDKKIILIGKILYKSDSKNEVIAKIKDINFLSNIQFYQSALVSIPKDPVKLYDDQNKEREYQFTDNKMEGIVNIDSLKGDSLKVNLQIAFKGNLPNRFLAFETKNISSTPQMLFNKKNMKIDHWDKEIRITAESNLENIVDANYIKNLFYDENINVSIENSGDLEYMLDTNNTNENDLNTYINDVKDSNNTVVSNYKIDSNSLTIFFNEDVNYERYLYLKNDVKDKFKIDENQINSELKKKYTLNIYTEDIDLNSYTQKLLENDINIISTEKNAIFDVSEIELDEKTYFYDGNTINVWLKYPEDTNKTEIELNIEAYYSRDKIMYIGMKE